MTRVKSKVYYIPGILSLIILPVIFINYANKKIIATSMGVIPIVLADTNLPKIIPEAFKKFNGSFPPKRNYIDIIFTGKSKDDGVKLDFAQIEIREILSENDSINGVHFQFSDNAQYGTFFRAVDVLRSEGAKRYMPLDKDLWFYHFPPDTTNDNWVCGTKYNTIYVDQKLPFWKKANDLINKSWKSS